MTKDKGEKIAATLIRQFSREKYFAISLPKLEDLELLAEVLSESFRCKVVWNSARSKISVYCADAEIPLDCGAKASAEEAAISC